VRRLEPILRKLSRAQTGFCQASEAVPVEQWDCQPDPGQWSAAELVAHLIIVERSVIASVERVIRHSPKPVPLLKRLHRPMWLVKSRLVRRKSPLPMDPRLIGSKESMLAEMRATRECTLALMEKTRERDLGAYYWLHQFIGMLNTYGWFEFIAAHQIRHTKQMREIAERLEVRG